MRHSFFLGGLVLVGAAGCGVPGYTVCHVEADCPPPQHCDVVNSLCVIDRDAGLDQSDGSTGGGTAQLDAGFDAGSGDSGVSDGGSADAGHLDAGTPDAGTVDAGTLDAGTPDAGPPDGGVVCLEGHTRPCAGNCRNVETCAGNAWGSCQPGCGAGLECVANACTCTQNSCAGCCQNGACVPGNQPPACGSGGTTCQMCPAGQSCSDAGACSGCNATACPSGCCSGATCSPKSFSTCGSAGSSCVSCDPLRADGCNATGQCGCGDAGVCSPGQHCFQGACRCDSTTCAGCCSGTTCLTSTTTSCGVDAGACTVCDATKANYCTNGVCRCGTNPACGAGQRCDGVSCVCDGTSCPSGCCGGGATCTTPSTAACGKGGTSCLACDTTKADQCLNGACSCGPSGSPCGPGLVCIGNVCTCSGASGCNGCCSNAKTCEGTLAFPTKCRGSANSCVACNSLTTDGCAAATGACACGNNPPCGAGQQCVGGQCKCTSTSCASGCCGPNETCVSPPTDTSCGTAGNACMACTGNTDRCTSGQCTCGNGPACTGGQVCCAGTCKSFDDVHSCGSCGNDCTTTAGVHVAASCSARQCAYACSPTNYQHCVGVMSIPPTANVNCESNLASDIRNCGACGFECQPTMNTQTATGWACANSKCQLTCAANRLDCNAVPSDGCEVAFDVQHCGSCTQVCQAGANVTPTCAAGPACAFACNTNFAHCVGNSSVPPTANVACETNLMTDANNCGQCGNVCGADQYCNNGTCACDATKCTATQACLGTGHCGCDAAHCGSGCCTALGTGGECLPGTDIAACGTGGGLCSSCPATLHCPTRCFTVPTTGVCTCSGTTGPTACDLQACACQLAC